MQTDDMRLDGNAAGGMLGEVFTEDVTAALATCMACGRVGPIGTLLEYGGSMGVVLRCPSCGTAMIRIVHSPGWLRMDVSAVSFLMIPDSTAAPNGGALRQ